jgi:hypothetical protein
MRRSTVLSIPTLLVFPGLSWKNAEVNTIKKVTFAIWGFACESSLHSIPVFYSQYAIVQHAQTQYPTMPCTNLQS